MTTPAARVAPAGPSTAEASRTAGAVAARYGETMRGGTRLRTPRAARSPDGHGTREPRTRARRRA